MKILATQSALQKMHRSFAGLKESWRVLLLLFLLTTTALSLMAQNQIVVRGRITDEKNLPVVGASVQVKGTTRGVTTNDNGVFEISAPATGTLVISSVGYPTREIAVNRQTTHNISLVPQAADLDQVVVIGYGTQRKRDVTGSTVSVRGETLNEIKAPNVLNQLQGRAAGVDIVSNGNQIGTGGEIRIRGNRSITGNNNPLVVVDGMVYGGSLNDINPENIASLDVLKDASATAIYGSRGSNGVIIITTKRGTSQRPVTTYNGYVGQVEAIGTYRLFNGPEFAQFKLDAAQGNSNVANSNPYALVADEQANLAAGQSTDWQKLLLKKGIRTSHDVNVRGGNDRTLFYFGLGYYRETGIISDQELDRYSFSVNIDHKMTEKLKIGTTASPFLQIETSCFILKAVYPVLLPDEQNTNACYIVDRR